MKKAESTLSIDDNSPVGGTPRRGGGPVVHVPGGGGAVGVEIWRYAQTPNSPRRWCREDAVLCMRGAVRIGRHQLGKAAMKDTEL